MRDTKVICDGCGKPIHAMTNAGFVPRFHGARCRKLYKRRMARWLRK
ncbi:MAG: hypothetical protein IPK17_01635 [Chloroflexi bacterium]|nr:hypothetical protein [Chloroflexota bacterium]